MTAKIMTSIFGLLYGWFVVVSFIPDPDAAVPYEPSRQLMIVFTLMFLLFFTGYLAIWTNELIGGIIFILWWIAMWFVEIFYLAPVEGADGGDRGGGIPMGFPLFVLGIVFIRRWYRGRDGRAVKTKPAKVAS